MATGTLLPAGYQTLQDATGLTIPGGLIWTYQAGSVTPQITYTDSALAVPNTNPIIVDGAGRWVAYVPPGTSYKLVYETPATPPSHGTVLRTVDNLSGPVFATGQVAFPATQVPSNDPNTLDDYEEGTWTPVLGGTGGQSGQTYGSQLGQYVKIGKLVYVSFDVTLTAKGTITGGLVIGGIPFAPQVQACGVATYFSGWAIPKIWLGLLVQTTWIVIQGLNAASTDIQSFSTADLTNTSRLIGAVSYMAVQ